MSHSEPHEESPQSPCDASWSEDSFFFLNLQLSSLMLTSNFSCSFRLQLLRLRGLHYMHSFHVTTKYLYRGDLVLPYGVIWLYVWKTHTVYPPEWIAEFYFSHVFGMRLSCCVLSPAGQMWGLIHAINYTPVTVFNWKLKSSPVVIFWPSLFNLRVFSCLLFGSFGPISGWVTNHLHFPFRLVGFFTGKLSSEIKCNNKSYVGAVSLFIYQILNQSNPISFSCLLNFLNSSWFVRVF